MTVARRPRVDLVDADGDARAGAERPPTRARDASVAVAATRAVPAMTVTRARAVAPDIRSIESSARSFRDASNCRVASPRVSGRNDDDVRRRARVGVDDVDDDGVGTVATVAASSVARRLARGGQGATRRQECWEKRERR